MRVMVIDPGKRTGVIVAELPELNVTLVVEYDLKSDILNLVNDVTPDYVIMEEFVLRKGKALQLSGQRMYSAELFGAVQAVCSAHNIPVKAVPAWSKDTITDGLLRKTGLWTKTVGKPHARDCARHLLREMWSRYPDELADWLRKEGG